MKRVTLILFLLSLTTAYSQDPESLPKVYDFSTLDGSTMDIEPIGKKMDSILRVTEYDSLRQLMEFIHYNTYTEKYLGFNIGFQSARADLGDLNGGLVPLGFRELSENFSGVPWGIDVRGKRWLLTYQLVSGIKNTSSNNDYEIEVNGINMELALGYDILHLRRLHFYPQVSFSLQDFDVDMTLKSSTSSLVTVNDLVFNPSGTRLERSSFNMSYGAELDYHLLYTVARGGIILGLRYGRVLTLSEGKFKINGKKSAFDLADSINESFFSVVAKFYVKR